MYRSDGLDKAQSILGCFSLMSAADRGKLCEAARAVAQDLTAPPQVTAGHVTLISSHAGIRSRSLLQRLSEQRPNPLGCCLWARWSSGSWPPGLAPHAPAGATRGGAASDRSARSALFDHQLHSTAALAHRIKIEDGFVVVTVAVDRRGLGLRAVRMNTRPRIDRICASA